MPSACQAVDGFGGGAYARRMRSLRIACLAFAVALALAACGGGNDVAEVNVGDGGQDIEVVGDGASVAVDQGGEVDIPESWPEGVPVPEGAPSMSTAGTSDGSEGWMLNYPQADEAAFDAYVATLRDAGAEEGLSLDQSGLRSETSRIAGHDVTVQLMEGVGMTVIVTPAP